MSSSLFRKYVEPITVAPLLFDLFFCALIALTATFWQAAGPDGSPGIAFSLYVAAVCWFSLTAGRLLSFFGYGRRAEPLTDMMDFVGGALLIQLFLFAVSYGCRLSVIVPFVLFGFVVGGGYVFLQGRVVRKEVYRHRQSVQVLLLLALALAAITLWVQQPLVQYKMTEGKLFFQPSIDFYIHTAQFLPFANGDFELGNFFFSGLKVYFYHYGSYMFSAVAAGIGVESALNLATSFWLPFGMLLMVFSAFALGGEVGGFAAGLGAVVALLLVPDPSAYLFFNKYFSFHWLLQLSPGCAYGLALVGYCFVWLLRYKKYSCRRCLFFACIAACCLLFVRAQFIPLLFMAGACWLLFFASHLSNMFRFTFLLAGGLLFAFRSVITSTLVLAPSLTGPAGGPVFLSQVFLERVGGKYFGLAEIVQSGGVWLLAGGGFLLIVLSILGIYLLLAVFLLWKKMIGNQAISHWDALPWFVLFCYCLLAWVLPVSTRSDPFELLHRPFVIVYFCFAVWVGSQLAVVVGQRCRTKKFVGCIVFLLVGGLGVPWWQGEGGHSDRLSHMSLRQGVHDAALYLRDHAAVEDVFIDPGFNHYGTVGVIALSQKRAFFTPTIASAVNRNFPQYKKIIKERLVFRRRLYDTASVDEAARMAAGKGIRWAIIPDGRHSAWEDGAATAKVFESCNTRVYDLQLLTVGKGVL